VCTQEPEIGARSTNHLGNSHQRLVRDIAIGQDHLIDPVRGEERIEFGLGVDGNPLRRGGTSQTGRIPTPGDRRNLGGGEGNHLNRGLLTQATLKIMQVTTGSP
jgi:hypothetical protein